eukprot:sb/3465227/
MSASEGNKDEYFAMTFNPFNPKTEAEDESGFDKEIMCELGEKSLVSPLVSRCQNYLLENCASMTRLLSDSAVRSAWDWFVLFLTVWAVFANPIQSIFDGNIYYNPTVDWITDVVFNFDIIVNFRSTYVNQNWFATIFNTNLITKSHRLLGGLKSIRIFRMIKVGMNLDNYTRKGPISLALIIVFFLSLGHIFACFWYLLGKYHYENEIDGWITYYLKDNNYDPELRDNDVMNLSEMQPGYYSASLYFIMTTFCTVGFGNISPWNTPEQIFCIFVMLIGAFLYAIVFGSATNIIMQMGAQQSRSVLYIGATTQVYPDSPGCSGLHLLIYNVYSLTPQSGFQLATKLTFPCMQALVSPLEGLCRSKGFQNLIGGIFRFLDQQQNLELYTKVNKFPQDLKNRVEDYFYYQW